MHVLKKLLLLPTVFLLLSWPIANAQISHNIYAGINSSNLKNELNGVGQPIQLNSFAYRQSFLFGTSFTWQFRERIGLSFNIQSSWKGGARLGGHHFNRLDILTWYLDLIPEIEFDLFKTFSIGFGLNHGIRLLDKTKLGHELSTRIIQSEDQTKNDFGLTSSIKLNLENMVIFARYNDGLTSIREFSSTRTAGFQKFYNKNIQVGVGIPIYILNDKEKIDISSNRK